MSVSLDTAKTTKARGEGRDLWPGPRWALLLLLTAGILAILSAVRLLTDSQALTSSGTAAAALRLAVPIGLAGLGGLYSERTGIVNIGLEGMMILGTWFGGWAGFEFGVWWGVAFGILGGALGGLLHAVATVTFGVDHIVSGVAINILAGGVTRFLSVVVLTDLPGGGATQSPNVTGDIGSFTFPVLAGGNLFGWESPDALGALERSGLFFLADAAGLLRGALAGLSWLTVIALALVPLTWWFLWRTPLGLRMRSVGENPYAAESLGVRVYTMKYIGVTISGALAGLGGVFLVVESAGIYKEGQTAGRGFIGLAAMIFGNWRPMGTAAGAGVFGFADALQLRSSDAVHGLLLFIAILALLGVFVFLMRRRLTPAGVMAVMGGAFLIWFLQTDTVPNEFIAMTPYVVTLLVLAFATQHLRMPAADGLRYRKGEAG
ncbi:MAG: ABC transporter permease [Nitriliruptorales bacterium]|nr:ABC transporter permease [Nitriliruptorales bacterium]